MSPYQKALTEVELLLEHGIRLPNGTLDYREFVNMRKREISKPATIGSHTIIGARSVVTRDIAEHTLAAGSPAKPVGEVGDRAAVRVL